MTERMWCQACGSVTRDLVCDCNRYGAGHEMHREPNFVNYADAMQEAAHEQAQRVCVLEKALTDILEANMDFRDGMPQSWDGDPLQDACDAAAKLLGSLSGVGQVKVP